MIRATTQPVRTPAKMSRNLAIKVLRAKFEPAEGRWSSILARFCCFEHEPRRVEFVVIRAEDKPFCVCSIEVNTCDWWFYQAIIFKRQLTFVLRRFLTVVHFDANGIVQICLFLMVVTNRRANIVSSSTFVYAKKKCQVCPQKAQII